MATSNKSPGITRIIACGVFKPVMDYLRMEKRYPHLRITYLQSNLHVWPQELKKRLLQAVAAAQKRNEKVICLYGNCFPGINEACEDHGVVKMPGDYCYEMLLGAEQFRKLINEAAGTYFLEQDLMLNFEEHCVTPLELYDEIMKKYCFAHYTRLLYVRQPTDPDLIPRAEKIAEFLELALEIRNADYSFLEGQLVELIESQA